MPLDLFEEVVWALGPTARQLHLYNWGEPLLNKDILQMVRLAAATGAKVYLATNLNAMKPEMAEPLVRSGLYLLSVSIDGARQESYAAYRQGGDMEVVVANLRRLVEARRRARRSRLRIRWQFLAARHNEGEVGAARAQARALGVEFRVHRLHVGLGADGQESLSERVQHGADWLPRQAALNRYQTENAGRVCRHLWDRTVINFNGSVWPCCQVFDPRQAFADRFDPDFGRIWNGPAYMAARALFAGSEAAAPEIEGLVCRQCLRLGNVL